ncbi:MAG: LysR family transcriptional regulator [Rhizomicrobium sp.]
MSKIETAAIDPDLWRLLMRMLAVAEAGSLRKAAARIGTSRSTLSREIQQAERILGSRLFDREAEGLVVTEQGAKFLTDARRLRSATDPVLLRVAQKVRAYAKCSVAMGDGIATYWLPRFLARFYREHPEIELRLICQYEREILRGEQFDIGIMYREPANLDRLGRKVGSLHIVPMATQDYLERCGTPKTVSDLTQHNVFELLQYTAAGGSWLALCEGGSEVRTRLFTNQSSVMVEAVRNGAGIGLLPTYVAAIYPSLVMIPLIEPWPLPIWLSYSREAAREDHVRKTIDFLAEHVFAPERMPWFSDTFVRPQSGWAERQMGSRSVVA